MNDKAYFQGKICRIFQNVLNPACYTLTERTIRTTMHEQTEEVPELHLVEEFDQVLH